MMSLVQDNLMNREGYTPYCGDEVCKPEHYTQRTKFDGEQFTCKCGWRSRFSKEFIQKYKEKWNLE